MGSSEQLVLYDCYLVRTPSGGQFVRYVLKNEPEESALDTSNASQLERESYFMQNDHSLNSDLRA